MSPSQTDRALAVSKDQTAELAVTQAESAARSEIEGAMVLARRFPRNENEARGRTLAACKRREFAESAHYVLRRGRNVIVGPSVALAREFARVWGNIRYGADIVYDDDEKRVVRAWAWDVERNTRPSEDVGFKKLILRGSKWTRPDERDLRELTNGQAARAVRNCLLHLLPDDFKQAAMNECDKTIASAFFANPEAAREKLITGFQQLGISVDALEAWLGCALTSINARQVVQLRAIYKDISTGRGKWSQYMPLDVGGKAPPSIDEVVNVDTDMMQTASDPIEQQPPAPAKTPKAKKEPAAPPEGMLFKTKGSATELGL